jgi:hypothetical protein
VLILRTEAFVNKKNNFAFLIIFNVAIFNAASALNSNIYFVYMWTDKAELDLFLLFFLSTASKIRTRVLKFLVLKMLM